MKKTTTNKIIKIIEASYTVPGNTVELRFLAILTPQGVEWVLAQLGRGHETRKVMSLYGDWALNRYALEKHLGLWD